MPARCHKIYALIINCLYFLLSVGRPVLIKRVFVFGLKVVRGAGTCPFLSGGGGRSDEGPLLDRGEYFVEKAVDGFGMGDEEHVSAFWKDMGWGGQPEGEDLIAAAVDVVERLGDGAVLPLEDGIQGPADEAVIAGADHLSHQPAARCGTHPDGMFDDRG
jgi:hypothetical protein